MDKLLAVKMFIHEKEKAAVAMDELELEKGEYMLVDLEQRNKDRNIPRRGSGLDLYCKVSLLPRIEEKYNTDQNLRAGRVLPSHSCVPCA
jgi:hypothetical protein